MKVEDGHLTMMKELLWHINFLMLISRENEKDKRKRFKEIGIQKGI